VEVEERPAPEPEPGSDVSVEVEERPAPEPEPGSDVSVEVEERPAPEPETSGEGGDKAPWTEILAFATGALALFGGQRGMRAGRAAWERRQAPERTQDGL
jgi:hypothetical protein